MPCCSLVRVNPQPWSEFEWQAGGEGSKYLLDDPEDFLGLAVSNKVVQEHLHQQLPCGQLHLCTRRHACQPLPRTLQLHSSLTFSGALLRPLEAGAFSSILSSLFNISWTGPSQGAACQQGNNLNVSLAQVLVGITDEVSEKISDVEVLQAQQ